MNPSEELNDTLAVHHPAAHACLSRVGRRMFFPLGIPAQAQQARSAKVNATIGQLTDGSGGAMPLRSMAKKISELSLESTTLYAAQGGNKDLRRAWRDRLSRAGEGPKSDPFCTVGLTHGLSLLADLFVDEDTDVLLPAPCWGNYNLIFRTRAGGRVIPYPVLQDGEFAANAMAEALSQVRTTAVVVLNFPGNPTGYTPTKSELAPWLEAIRNTSKPVVVICDDAYNGFVYEDDCIKRSPFFDLTDVDPSRVLPVKVDGATKELCFFGGRVGFVTFGVEGKAAAALEGKIKGMARASVSSGPAISQAIVLAALSDPNLDAERAALMKECILRYQALKQSLIQANVPHQPFNSGFFALIPVPDDPEALRLRLLEQGIGVVAIPRIGAIRIAYSSTSVDDIPVLVSAIAQQMNSAAT